MAYWLLPGTSRALPRSGTLSRPSLQDLKLGIPSAGQTKQAGFRLSPFSGVVVSTVGPDLQRFQ